MAPEKKHEQTTRLAGVQPVHTAGFYGELLLFLNPPPLFHTLGHDQTLAAAAVHWWE